MEGLPCHSEDKIDFSFVFIYFKKIGFSLEL